MPNYMYPHPPLPEGLPPGVAEAEFATGYSVGFMALSLMADAGAFYLAVDHFNGGGNAQTPGEALICSGVGVFFAGVALALRHFARIALSEQPPTAS